MGRIRKTLSVASFLAMSGTVPPPVRWGSSAEKAAPEQNAPLAEQNRLLGGAQPAQAPRAAGCSGRLLR
jgi:hypothetical protein